MKIGVICAVAVIAFASSLHADVIAHWDFNSPAPDGAVGTGSLLPNPGQGVASLVGGVTGTFVAGDSNADPAGAPDNSGWNTSKYPAAGEANKASGARFAVDTTGYENIEISWSQRNSATASRYSRLQYTIDGVTFADADVFTMEADSVFTNRTASLRGVVAAGGNPLFAVQVVSEFEDSAIGYGVPAFVATKDGSTYSTQGTIRFDMVAISGTRIQGVNTSPEISDLGPQTVRANHSTPALEFTVSDLEQPADELVVYASSSDSSVIADGNIELVGGGGTRSVVVKAGPVSGSARVTLTVADLGGRTGSTSFEVVVLPENLPPSIVGPGYTNLLANSEPITLTFDVSDPDTGPETLAVSAVSMNPSLMPDDNLHLDGTGTNRTLTLSPAAGKTGVAPIVLRVSDGVLSTECRFAVAVTSSDTLILEEPFGYSDGSLVTNSGGLWSTRSGTEGECMVSNGVLHLVKGQTEDVMARFPAGSCALGNQTALYASFQLKALSVPKLTAGVLAHFSDGTSLRGRLYAAHTNADAGNFRLHVSNGAEGSTEFPRELHTNSVYRVILKYDIDNAASTLWVDPASESDENVVAWDFLKPARVTSFGFRQDADVGADFEIDNLKLAYSFEAALQEAPAELAELRWTTMGQRLVLGWDDPRCVLQWAPDPSGPFQDVAGAVNPFTTFSSGNSCYYRLIKR